MSVLTIPGNPERELHESSALLPRPCAKLAGPTYEQWLGTGS